jgi:hypothetical protein
MCNSLLNKLIKKVHKEKNFQFFFRVTPKVSKLIGKLKSTQI